VLRGLRFSRERERLRVELERLTGKVGGNIADDDRFSQRAGIIEIRRTLVFAARHHHVDELKVVIAIRQVD